MCSGVHNDGPGEHVLVWDEAPVPAVERVVAIVAQDKVMALGHHDLAALYVVREHLRALRRQGELRREGKLSRKLSRYSVLWFA